MSKRTRILAGMAAGLGWGIALLWIGTAFVNIPIFSFVWMLALSFLFPGLVLAAMIGRLAARRFFDDALIDGDAYAPGSPAEIDERVLRNTVEQLVLALAVWPAAGHLLVENGPGVVLCLGLGFALARIAFWIGYHVSPPLRAFGFAATFYPTPLAIAWAVFWWLF